MSDANRLFTALSGSAIVAIDLIENQNSFVYSYLKRWKRQCESNLTLLPTVEVKRNPKATEFHFLDGGVFKASCIDFNDRFYIGFRISAVLRVLDLYIHLVNREKYLSDALPQTNSDTSNNAHFTPLLFSANTIAEFPRELPLTPSHLEAAIRLSFMALEFMLWHELTHLWDGHGPYKQLRKELGHSLNNVELRTLEWEADRLAISRMMLMYRAREHVIPLAKNIAPLFDRYGGQKLFDGTIATPRIYARCVLFTLLIFFWHFGDIVTEQYLDKSHPFYAARSFYFLSELGRVLAHSVYAPWQISHDEYIKCIATPTLLEAVKCWDEMAGQNIGTANISSALHLPYAMRDLKRFEEASVRIQAEIKKYGLAI
jgi:hypothetical protein